MKRSFFILSIVHACRFFNLSTSIHLQLYNPMLWSDAKMSCAAIMLLDSVVAGGLLTSLL